MNFLIGWACLANECFACEYSGTHMVRYEYFRVRFSGL